jgi:hypothetical protein
VPDNPGSAYERALRQVVSAIQVLIYRRETSPIRDREEVYTELEWRLVQLKNHQGDAKERWRKTILELAAYAVFAAIADE